LFLYLLFNYKDFKIKRPFSTPIGFFILSFILVFLSLPIGYGSSIFDIYLYKANVPECKEGGVEVFRKTSAEDLDLLFLMGHTSGREIFSYATDSPPRLILVDRLIIKSLTVIYDHDPKMSIRVLLTRLPMNELEPENAKELEEEIEKEWYKKENQ
jgi:hypothetical protein